MATAPPLKALPSYLPVPNPTTSYWRRETHRLEHHRSTSDLPASCETLIIGTGLTGVSTAYHLLNHPSFSSSTELPTNSPPASSPSVLLLEARTTCSGATGRNGEHLKPAYMNLSSNRASLGAAAAAAELAHFAEAQIDALEDVVRREAIDCEFRRGKSWDVYLDARRADAAWEQWQEWKGEGWDGIRGMEMWSARQEGGSEDGLEERCQVRGAKTVVESPAAMLWPYKLTVGLLEKVLEKGAQLQTETPVLELLLAGHADREDGWRWVARTPRGEVKCKKVVVATNAYTAGLLPEYEGVIRPVKGVNSLMESHSRQADVHPALKNSFNIHQGPGLANYIVPQPTGSVIVGGAFHGFSEAARERYDCIDDSTLLSGAAGNDQVWGLRSTLPRWIKGWEDKNEGEIWSGIMGYASDGHPHVGRVPGRDGMFIAAGFCGRGMLIIFLGAKELAGAIAEGREVREGVIPQCFIAGKDRLKKPV